MAVALVGLKPDLQAKRRGCAGFCLVAGLGLLGGCGATPERPESADLAEPVSPWVLRQQALSQITSFELVGRAAIQSGDKGYSAGLRWTQTAKAYAMELVGPFSQGTLRIEGDATGVSLSSGGESVRAPTLQALLGADFGWQVPAEALRFWVLGLPAPEWPAEQVGLDAQGRLKDMRQGPWRVSVLDYASESALALPKRVFVNGEAASLRLVIKDFAVNPALDTAP